MENMLQDHCQPIKEKISDLTYKEILTNQLERVGSGGIFVWSIFLLVITPNVLNGFHVNSYTMLGHVPDLWCDIDDLKNSNWTSDEMFSISQGDLSTKGCTIWDWDYISLASMTYDEALNYTTLMIEINRPAEILCSTKGTYRYKSGQSTFVADWDLVCERSIQRTSAQVFLSLGKFFGSFTFGILADRFGRKTAFTVGAMSLFIGNVICTVTPWYAVFLVGRFFIGLAASGLFYPGFTMLVENVCLKHRSWMSIAFSASYPIGMIIMALAAYLVEPWRYLQLTLTIPTLLVFINCYLLPESPRWLITHGRYDQAYYILFKRKSHYEINKKALENNLTTNKKTDNMEKMTYWEKLKNGPLKQIIELFATSKLRKLILTSYFMFCATSLCYYVTALNASNLTVSRFLYVAITGLVDLPSYLIPVIMLRFTGRKVTTMSLFLLTGIALLLVMAISANSVTWIVVFAMLGRFGISAAYSVLTLFVAELFPTEIRNSALGTCSSWAHIGSISAPYAVDVLGPISWYLPTTICGLCVLIAGLLTLTLPETGSSKLIDRIEEPTNSDTELNK